MACRGGHLRRGLRVSPLDGARAARIPCRQSDTALPGPTAAIGQILVAAADVSLSAGVLFALLPEVSYALYPQFLAAYVVAIGVAVLTHSPGGLGVFEAMIVLLLPTIGKPELAAALIGYRLIYYVLPFALAVVSLAIAEGGRLRQRARPLARAGQSVAVSLAPLAMAALVFGAGATLILTGALPATRDRIAALLTVLPPFLLDLSHAAASVLGTVLMFVAYGLHRRLDIAWLSAILILLSGALAALLRGMDIEEAALLLGIAALLGWTRPAFYRQSALIAERPDGRWMAAIGSVLAISLFLGFFAYKNVEYRNALWLQFAPNGNAARFLRASLVAMLALIAIALHRVTRPMREPTVTKLPPGVWDKALASCERTEAHLARTGDKAFIVASAGDAFLMYRVRGRSFIVMGDPVGPEERWSGLVWQLREAADRQGGRVAFYECGPRFLPYAVDLGLAIMKLGEEASVALANFSLEGKARANLRHAVNRMEREGATFRLIEGDELERMLPELRAVSDEWLVDKGQREKQFSLGRFAPAYLRGGPIGIVEQAGRVVAFANLWTLPTRRELSFDLMRQRVDAPSGTMDFLFVSMMRWGKEQGYDRISLGVAPLSGIESRRLAPLWARIAGAVFQHGERLYGYRGLRQYKEKFRPEWRSSYFAAPRGLAMAAALIDVTLLVSAPSPNDTDGHPSPTGDRTGATLASAPLPGPAAPLGS